jgi:hypothetical protein
MTIPVKAVRNEYDGTEQFAGGYPAVFGGTDQGGADATLVAEVRQESRGTLDTAGPFTQYFGGQPPYDDLYFYWTTAWRRTGQAWRPPNDRNEGEMASIATVSIDDFSSLDPPDTVLAKLIRLTGAPGGSDAQRQQFLGSETAAALVQFVYDNLPPDDGS